MKNRYPAICPCGADLPVGAGEGDKTATGWVFRCGACAGGVIVADRPAPVVAPPIDGYTLLSGHAASAHQAAVFDHFKRGRGSRIVKAVAGSGKTTTSINAIRYLPEWMHVQLLAFGRKPADQLRERIKELEALGERSYRNVRAGTFHSIGLYAIRKYLNLAMGAMRVDDGKVRQLLKNALGATPDGEETYRTYGSFAVKLVALAKGEGIGALVPDLDARWWDLIEHHGLYLDTTDADPAVGIELARRALRLSNEAAKEGHIDNDDMLYLVVLWKLALWRNHVVVCDEAQDTNPVRRAMLHLMLRPGGRLYAVGDPRQSIFGFTGASVDAMDLIAKEFNTTELPLTVSYRCARAVVERAQTWVPYIESHADAADGSVLDDVPLHRALELLTANDAILCRQTAPLVELAYGLLARRRPCQIMGKEIGEGLVNLVEQQKARGIDRLIAKLEAWRDREMAKFIAKGDETRAEGVADRVSCLTVLIGALPEPERTIPGLVASIRALFSDDRDSGILTLATVHKSKGLEWERVAILRPELMPSRAARQEWQEEQEFNLMYVAATRAKQELIYVAAEDMVIDPPRRAA